MHSSINPPNLYKKLVKQGFKADGIKEKVEKASNIPREILLQETENNNNVSSITLTMSYNRSAPNVSLIPKFWIILIINEHLASTYMSDPMVSFK